MNENPLVSVVMSCYNEEIRWIKGSIDSILEQTYINFEFIVVCDNPNYDELRELLINYKNVDKRVNIIFNEKNIGLTSSLNLALKQCNGQFIARMDADDISEKERLEKQIKVFKDNKDIDFIMSAVKYIDENDNVIRNSKMARCKEHVIKKCLKYGNISVHPTWMYKKTMLDELKEYDDINYAEDYDFLCRAIISGYKIKGIEEYLLKYRLRNAGITKSKRAYQEINAQIVAKNYKKALNNKELYNPSYDINNINSNEINEFYLLDNEFKAAKRSVKKEKSFKSILRMISILNKSKYKRVQIYNYIRLKAILLSN